MAWFKTLNINDASKDMKRIFFITLRLAGLLSACELDNYPGPTASLSGTIIDDETGEPVQQDIIRGTVIELTEHGYDPVQPQYLIIKNDGSYENSRLFANTYTVQPVRGNFIAVEPQEVAIKENTKLDFHVIPYIRVKDVSIEKAGTIIKATFRLEQTVPNNIVKIGLYAHPDPHVGEPMAIARTEQELHRPVSDDELFTLELDPAAHTEFLKQGNTYFFRVGALIDVGEAKFNYEAAVAIAI